MYHLLTRCITIAQVRNIYTTSILLCNKINHFPPAAFLHFGLPDNAQGARSATVFRDPYGLFKPRSHICNPNTGRRQVTSSWVVFRERRTSHSARGCDHALPQWRGKDCLWGVHIPCSRAWQWLPPQTLITSTDHGSSVRCERHCSDNIPKLFAHWFPQCRWGWCQSAGAGTTVWEN